MTLRVRMDFCQYIAVCWVANTKQIAMIATDIRCAIGVPVGSAAWPERVQPLIPPAPGHLDFGPGRIAHIAGSLPSRLTRRLCLGLREPVVLGVGEAGG